MFNELEILKKKLLYRASYRGTKEMDILLTSFVKKYINKLSKLELLELEKFLELEDEIILEFYNSGNIKRISDNPILKIFKNFNL
tara:strand:+ start:23 stop:277 length:255 start_codon:yes stop_codon:yes gene_type:complete